MNMNVLICYLPFACFKDALSFTLCIFVFTLVFVAFHVVCEAEAFSVVVYEHALVAEAVVVEDGA